VRVPQLVGADLTLDHPCSASRSHLYEQLAGKARQDALDRRGNQLAAAPEKDAARRAFGDMPITVDQHGFKCTMPPGNDLAEDAGKVIQGLVLAQKPITKKRQELPPRAAPLRRNDPRIEASSHNDNRRPQASDGQCSPWTDTS